MPAILSSYRFAANQLSTKPGPKGKVLTYVDVRHIAAALDSLAEGWSSDVTLSHNGQEYAAVCRLVISGIVRSDVGSGETPPDASNQAFRRAAAAHGLGRYLWVGEPEPLWATWMVPMDMMEWALDVGAINGIEHGRNALRQLLDTRFDGRLTRDNWRQVCQRFYETRLARKEEKAITVNGSAGAYTNGNGRAPQLA